MKLKLTLIKRLQSGKEDALDYIVDRYLPLIKSVVQQVLRPIQREELIGECVNDVFYRFGRTRGSFAVVMKMVSRTGFVP